MSRRRRRAAIAAPAAFALFLALTSRSRFGAVDDVVRIGVPALALLAVAGFGPARLLLPERARRHEPLWVLPLGACVLALGMAALGYAHVPFRVNLAVTLAASAALGVFALRRPRPPAPIDWRSVAWALYVSTLVALVALLPLFRAGFATVTGMGSDAHLAAGTAELLRHAAPTEVRPELPVDQVPLVWRSKPPIYYPLAAVAEAAGVETWQALSLVSALVLALAALGVFLLVRDGLGARLGPSVLALGLVALNPMLLHMAMHPYYNQTWGWLTIPFALLLGLWAVHGRDRRAAALLVAFVALCGFAYPLALPIPVLALWLWWRRERRERRDRGEPVPTLRAQLRRRLGRRRNLIWAVPLALVLAVPLLGVLEKLSEGWGVVLDPRRPLEAWGGDLWTWYPERSFLSLGLRTLSWVLVPLVLAFAAWELRRLPRRLAAGLAGVVVLGLLGAVWFRLRDGGWYFHFKLLTFTAPFAVALAALGMARLRRGRGLLLGLWLFAALSGARLEIAGTFDQLPAPTLELREWTAAVPPGASIRLDIDPDGTQLWAAYMLAERPLCSERPLTWTSYPHVPRSRRADYVLSPGPRPRDAIGPPLRANDRFALYALRPDLPGPERCSRRMVQTVTALSL